MPRTPSSAPPTAQGLLLDIGGVVLRGGPMLVRVLADEEPGLRKAVDRLAVATERDELWQRMLRQEVSERAYWAGVAAELGAAIGEDWDTRTMITKMYDRPAEEWLNDAVVDLMVDTGKAGLPLGALTNDLADFHGQEWVARQRWLDHFDVIVDASHTGVLKPDPRAFKAGAEALGLHTGEIVYLDDMPWNVAGGAAAGLQAIAVDHTDPWPAAVEARRRLGLAA
ncbi:MAG: HAD-IA family hydrolase [Sciscionella sp.]